MRSLKKLLFLTKKAHSTTIFSTFRRNRRKFGIISVAFRLSLFWYTKNSHCMSRSMREPDAEPVGLFFSCLSKGSQNQKKNRENSHDKSHDSVKISHDYQDSTKPKKQKKKILYALKRIFSSLKTLRLIFLNLIKF